MNVNSSKDRQRRQLKFQKEILEFSRKQIEIEKKRISGDVIYAILFGDDAHVDSHIPGIVKMILDKYGHKMSPFIKAGFEEAVHTKDRRIKHALIFMALYLLPPFLAYFTNSKVEDEKPPPPPLVHREGLMYYVNKIVGPSCEYCLTGNVTLHQMVYLLREEYIATLGVVRDFA